MKVDLEEMKMLHGPYRKYPIYFMDYPQVGKMLENFMPMVEELEKLRKVAEAAEDLFDDQFCCTEHRLEIFRLIVKEWKGE